MSKVMAMVLAGGKGTRMDVLCQVRPKPLVPFAGKYKVIDFSLSNCIHSKIDNIAVLIDHQRASVATYLKRWQATNARGKIFNILEPGATSYHGTADAIYQNLGYLQKYPADRVLVLAGDHVYKMDYRKMLAFHEQKKADVTIGVVQVPIEQADRFGTVLLDRDDRITSFEEKTSRPRSNLASMGIYIFNRELFIQRLKEDAAESASPHDFGYAIIPRMTRLDKVYAYKFDGYWRDIGTVDSYYESNLEFLKEPAIWGLNGNWIILTENFNLTPSKKTLQGNIENSLISPGCTIKGRVINSVLSPGVVVEEQAVVKNSILMSDVYVGYHSTVESSIVDEMVTIGKFCYVGYGNSQNSLESCTVTGKGVEVPPHTAISRGCRIPPYSSAADFDVSVLTRDYQLGKTDKPIVSPAE